MLAKLGTGESEPREIAAFQLRDLPAKAGTDKAESSGDIVQARDQLGHTTVTMTEHYVRNRKGKKITPTKYNCGPMP